MHRGCCFGQSLGKAPRADSASVPHANNPANGDAEPDSTLDTLEIMKSTPKIFAVVTGFSMLLAPSVRAQLVDATWVGGDGDFFAPGNWNPAGVPGVDHITKINNGGTATIASDAGDRALAWLRLGETPSTTTESGHVVMDGGFLRIGGTLSDEKIRIGEGTVQSSFIMNGGTIYYDGPDEESLVGTSADGINKLDWEVGEHGVGRFEMHGDSVFRVGDDLKIAENSAGRGSCLIDGNARVSVGSGISVSDGGDNEQVLVIGGNALVEAGNSMGAGSPEGYTDEGYLSLSIGSGLAEVNANVTVQENATLNFRVLSSRDGVTLFTLKDSGQVHIFDVLTGRGFIDDQTPPDRPERVGGFRNSLSSGANADSTLILQDNAQMTVNASDGLGISGPRNAGDAGGKALMAVRDSASFRVEQYFALGTGTDPAACDGTLEVRGPDATVSIGENFNMAVDPDGVVATGDDLNPGKSTLLAVITGSTHSTVQVDGIARIAQGILKVTLDGYTPVGGEVFTLIQGGTVEGEFRETDFTDASLAEGLSWEVEYAADAVILSVAGESQQPVLSILPSGDSVSISWTGTGSLEQADALTGSWAIIPNAPNPYTPQATEAAAFFRIR